MVKVQINTKKEKLSASKLYKQWKVVQLHSFRNCVSSVSTYKMSVIFMLAVNIALVMYVE